MAPRCQENSRTGPVSYTGTQLSSLCNLISEPRFRTYLRACGNDQVQAMQLYEWNLAVSAAFMAPLQVMEVAIRNAAADAIARTHGADWPRNNGFRIALGQRARGYDPARDLLSAVSKFTRSNTYSPGKVIAELRFAFWQEIFTRRHDGAIWNLHLHSVLPNAPNPNVQIMRGWAFEEVGEVRKLRNRIAHHEPIFPRNLVCDYERVRDIASWRDSEGGVWIDRVSKVRVLLASKPSS